MDISDGEGLKEIVPSGVSTQPSWAPGSLPIMWPSVSQVMNGIPEGQLLTFGFMPGGSAPSPSPNVELLDQLDEQIGQMAREFQQNRETSSSVTGSNSMTIASIENGNDGRTIGANQDQDQDYEELDLALGVGEFFSFLETMT